MNKPNVEDAREAFDAQIDRWILGEVTPYAQSLLDKAAKRMHRHRLEFWQGMGHFGFSIDGDVAHKLNDAFNYPNDHTHRYVRAFPELEELHQLAFDIEDKFNRELGDM